MASVMVAPADWSPSPLRRGGCVLDAEQSGQMTDVLVKVVASATATHEMILGCLEQSAPLWQTAYVEQDGRPKYAIIKRNAAPG